MTARENNDVLDLLDYVWQRLERRMEGLSDSEWEWRPSEADADISIKWRLGHITDLLSAQRNWTWLGVPVPHAPRAEGAPRSAGSACTAMATAYQAFRANIGGDAVDFDAEIGPVAGPFESATRRSFVLHLTDELIHHGAEAALLRDLYPHGDEG